MDFSYLLHSFAYILLAFALFLIGKIAYSVFHPKIKVNYELVERDNLAFALSLIGYYVGVIAVIGGAIHGPSDGLLQDLINIGSYGLLAIILLNLASFINDKLLFRKFDIGKEIITDKNVGTGAIEFGNFVATGLIIYGAIVGEFGGYDTAIIYWLVAQLVFLLVGWVYNLILPYDIHDHIEKDNVAVGIGYAGAIIAVANLIRFGIQSDFVSWGETLMNLGLETGIGLILLPALRFATDKILLPGENLTDEIVNQEHPNIGAALTEAFAYISGSVLLTWCL